MKFVHFTLIVVLCKVSRQQENGETFLAAVYEHQIIFNNNCIDILCSRDEALVEIEGNLAVYEEMVIGAASSGASIILFPEDGLGGLGNRQTIRPFLEYVPMVADLSSPCFEDVFDQTDDYVKIRLSCLAAENNIYIAANMATAVYGCDNCGLEHGNQCYFNTLVIFDNKGRLAAVYHKYNLWTGEEVKFDIPDLPELVTLDTPFGRLGLIICADLFWDSPTLELVEQYGINTLLVPLYWWDLFPHQLAHSVEDAWARGLQVNLLASNIRHAEEWSSGSGIYSPTGHVEYFHDISPTSGGKLLIGELDITPAKTEVYWSEYATENQHLFPSLESSEFTATVYDDVYKFVALSPEVSRVKVCSEDDSLCCLLDYQANLTSHQDVFALGVFSGGHSRDGSVRGMYYIQMCTVMKCDPKHIEKTCAQDQSWDYGFLTSSETVFSQLELSGTFNPNTRVYPEVLFDQVQLVPSAVQVSTSGVLSVQPAAPPLVSLSLFGRVYQLDADFPQDFCPAIPV